MKKLEHIKRDANSTLIDTSADTPMKSSSLTHRFRTATGALAVACALAASSASAAIVWDLNPEDKHESAGSDTVVFTSSGYDITARGYQNNGGEGSGMDLFFKNRPPDGGANESGLGLTNSAHNELNADASGPLQFIQLDLRSILTLGATDGQIAVTSLQSGESFQLFGSDFQGVLGTAISGPFSGLTFDDEFVAIPQFGLYDFISIVAADSASHVLPSRFSAEITPIPEMGTVMPIVGLLVAIGSTHVLRRRRAARSQI